VRPRLLTMPGVAQVIPIGGEVQAVPRRARSPRSCRRWASTLEKLEAALRDFGANTSGGFLEVAGPRMADPPDRPHSRIEDLQNLVVAVKNGQPILLTARRRQTGAGHQARRRQLQGQAGGDPVGAEAAGRRQRDPDPRGRKGYRGTRQEPAQGIEAPSFLFKQADFIEHSVGNVEEALRDGAILVAVILFAVPAQRAHHDHFADGHSGVAVGHRAGVPLLRAVDQHHDAGRPGDRHRRAGG
jgi:HME family heavy-metal exporter